MNRIDDQIARMKELYTYGTVKEDHKESRNLEYHKTGADGNEYGIIKENNKYYIKISTPAKMNVTESYNYIGGIMNKKDYQYDSYNKALKQLELKLSSINEAHEQKVDVTTLDPFKKNIVLENATEEMKKSIARQRQIMYNAGMIMNESANNYAVKGGESCNTDQPEGEHGKSSDKSTKTTANPEYAGSKVGLDKKAAPYDQNPTGLKEGVDGTDFAAGLGATGTGEADTDHNNAPFDETVNESEEINNDLLLDEEFDVIDGDKETDDETVFDEDDMQDGEEETDFPEGTDFEEMEDEPSGDADLDSEDDFEEGDVDLEEKISQLELELAELKAKVEGSDNTFDEDGASDELTFEIEKDPEDVEDETTIEVEEEDFDDEDEEGDGSEEGDDDEEDEVETYLESVRGKINPIVESVLKSMVKEDATILHDFGKHPGYRKKPMTTPPNENGDNEHGKDWNDESARGEKPFGEKIGDGTPFDEKVNMEDTINKAVKNVMESISKLKKKI